MELYGLQQGAIPNINTPDRRKPNWTETENIYLVEQLEKYRSIIASKAIDGNTNRKKRIVWEKITEGLNKKSPFVNRKADEVKRKWKNLSYLARREAFELKRQQGLSPSSSEPPDLTTMTPFNKRVISLCGIPTYQPPYMLSGQDSVLDPRDFTIDIQGEDDGLELGEVIPEFEVKEEVLSDDEDTSDMQLDQTVRQTSHTTTATVAVPSTSTPNTNNDELPSPLASTNETSSSMSPSVTSASAAPSTDGPLRSVPTAISAEPILSPQPAVTENPPVFPNSINNNSASSQRIAGHPYYHLSRSRRFPHIVNSENNSGIPNGLQNGTDISLRLLEQEKLQLEVENLRLCKHRMQVELEKVQMEKQKAQYDMQKSQLEVQKMQLEIQFWQKKLQHAATAAL